MTYCTTHIGKKNNIEYSWSNNIHELIVQYYFQLRRTSDYDILTKKLSFMLSYCLNNPYCKEFFLLYKLLIQTRDRRHKGERDLSYFQLFIWHQFFPNIACITLELFVRSYGSWRDIKGLCGFIRSNYCNEHPLIDFAINLCVKQLKLDILSQSISLVGKWAPRQNSKYGWLFNKIAYKYYELFFLKMPRQSAKRRAKKCLRQLLSSFNRRLKTPQVYMCQKKWAHIPFHRISSTTKLYHHNTFLKYCTNFNIDHLQKNPTITENFFEYELVRAAINGVTPSFVNKLWTEGQLNITENVIVMIDVSAYMSEDNVSLMSAIGIGIRISENNSIWKNHILLFAEYPQWVCLDNLYTFVDKVQYIMDIISKLRNTSCQLFHAFEKLFNNKIITQTNISSIFIISHLQAERKCLSNLKPIFKEISIISQTYKIELPHVVFWNVHKTNGFPATTQQENLTMISGFNSSVLKSIFHYGNSSFKIKTPENRFKNILSHYNHLSTLFQLLR
tara:strand:- start:919 stop:2427 length:1509 start_codon:yes stop_codon:yes gene_type:complete